jgi:iron complex transport system substrate-binding protein
MRPFILVCALCVSIAGCGKNPRKGSYFDSSPQYAVQSLKYAKGFEIRDNNRNTIITIKNPWQNAHKIEYNYFLSDTVAFSHTLDENHTIIKTPVKRVVCLSTTHIGFIDFIGKTASICGISGKDYVVNSELRGRINSGSVPDVGFDENLNFELLLKLKPDLVFAYGVNSTVTNTLRKLNELGIPSVMIAEYLEEEPLAKMEWVKVFAAFFDSDEDAGIRFDTVANQYQQLCLLAGRADNKPSVMMGLPWRGVWYVSGGKSYVAKLVEDAGGKYMWSGLNYKDSRPVMLEKVFEQVQDADFWLNPGDAPAIHDILTVDERFRHLMPIKRDQVFNNNNLLSPSGGNAFYEEGVVEPQIILSDLLSILHPQLLPSHHLKYYRKLE